MRACLVHLSAALLFSAAAHAATVPAPDPAQGDGGVSPFYTWNGEIPGQPGQMLRTEPLAPELGLGDASQQVRILYTSTSGVDGKTPVVVSGAYFAPKGTPPAEGWPLVAWAHGTTGVGDVCAPSWNRRSKRDVDYLNTWLRQGYAIVATDYQGLGTPGPHPYIEVRPEAYSVLDSVRAALSAFPNLARKIVIIGQSQGAQAAFATAGIAPDYAPELNIAGTVATGLPYLGSGMLRPPAHPLPPGQADPTLAYTLYIALVIQQHEPARTAEQLVTDAALPLLRQAPTTCVGSLFRAVEQAGLNRGTALKPAYVDAFTPVLPSMEYSTVKLPTPLFVGTGEEDHDVPPNLQRALVRDACAVGTVVQAHRYAGKDHSQTVNASLKDSVPFVQEILAGHAITPVCEPVPE